jgi:DNA-binding transcriptional MocR family regulator
MSSTSIQPRQARRASISDSLADAIERQIRDGAFKAGDKLPSLRILAGVHGCAKNTVVSAFETLVYRGLVEPRRGSGYYVARLFPRKRTEDAADQVVHATSSVRMIREQLRTEPNMLAVGDGFPPVDWLTDMRLNKYHAKVVRTGLGALFRYGDRFGYGPLREHLVHKLANIGVNAQPLQILLTHGANAALDLVIRYFVPPGGLVLADEPGYYPLFGKLKLAGAEIVGVPRLCDGPDVDTLERLLVTRRPQLFFTQSLAHNPTGSDISAAKALRILQLARQHNLLIVENDALADFKPTLSPRLSSFDQLERTIYISSFSKSFCAALRVGFLACDANLASDLADVKALVHGSSSEYCERTVDVMMNEAHYQRYLTRLRERLGQTTRSAVDLLESLGATVFARTEQSLYLWASFPAVPDSFDLAEALLLQKIMMAPGRVFSLDSSVISPWSRLNAASVLDPRFATALQAELSRRLASAR